MQTDSERLFHKLHPHQLDQRAMPQNSRKANYRYLHVHNLRESITRDNKSVRLAATTKEHSNGILHSKTNETKGDTKEHGKEVTNSGGDVGGVKEMPEHQS